MKEVQCMCRKQSNYPSNQGSAMFDEEKYVKIEKENSCSSVWTSPAFCQSEVLFASWRRCWITMEGWRAAADGEQFNGPDVLIRKDNGSILTGTLSVQPETWWTTSEWAPPAALSLCKHGYLIFMTMTHEPRVKGQPQGPDSPQMCVIVASLLTSSDSCLQASVMLLLWHLKQSLMVYLLLQKDGERKIDATVSMVKKCC